MKTSWTNMKHQKTCHENEKNLIKTAVTSPSPPPWHPTSSSALWGAPALPCAAAQRRPGGRAGREDNSRDLKCHFVSQFLPKKRIINLFGFNWGHGGFWGDGHLQSTTINCLGRLWGYEDLQGDPAPEWLNIFLLKIFLVNGWTPPIISNYHLNCRVLGTGSN